MDPPSKPSVTTPPMNDTIKTLADAVSIIFEELKKPEVMDGLQLHCNAKKRDNLFLKRDEMKKVTNTWTVFGKDKTLQLAWKTVVESLKQKYKDVCPEGVSFDQTKACLLSEKMKIPELDPFSQLNCDPLDLYGANNFIEEKYTYNGPRSAQPKVSRYSNFGYGTGYGWDGYNDQYIDYI